jgi:4'-phosphopantetheinyl transferase EntD
MADPHDIESCRNAYKYLSRDRLLQVRHEKAEFSAERIAAEQVLDALNQSFQRRIYGISRRTLCWTIVAAIAATIAAVAPCGRYFEE